MAKTMILALLLLVLVAGTFCSRDSFSPEDCPWPSEALETTNITVDSWDACLAALSVVQIQKGADLSRCAKSSGYVINPFNQTQASLGRNTTGRPSANCLFEAKDGPLYLVNEQMCSMAVRSYLEHLDAEMRSCRGCVGLGLCTGKPTPKPAMKPAPKIVPVKDDGCRRACDQCELVCPSEEEVLE